MKVYTKTGDEGQTSLIGGARVSKAHLRVEAYGTVDELNAYVGLLRDQQVNEKRTDVLNRIQERLFVMGALLATDPNGKPMQLPHLADEDIVSLEIAIDKLQENVPPMRHFILPGGHQTISFGHVARCVCRRAERLVVELATHENIDQLIIKYLNRLSDYLFVLCRAMHQELAVDEIPWVPGK